jgi:hypothetical protein
MFEAGVSRTLFSEKIEVPCENNTCCLPAFSSGRNVHLTKNTLFIRNGETGEYFATIQSVLKAGVSFTLFP